MNVLDSLRWDLRQALRSLTARPGHALAVAATWALGLGATVAVFAVAYGVLWKPLPYEEPDRLAIVWQTDLHNDSDSERASAPDLRDFQAQSRSFAGLAGVTAQPLDLRPPGGEPERVTGAGVAHDLFRILGVAAALGRGFAPEEDRPGAAGAAVLGHELWRRRFGADPAVLGTTVALDERPYTVVGVMPEGFDFPGDTELWVPLEATLGELGQLRGVHNVLVVGRLGEGVALAAAGAEMAGIAARLEAAYPEDIVGRGVRLE
ncbi:MAG TPA: ABC transporter permease, partial [Thermoanaerobaculia bacterium]|nr:ABC transporter permease [Thermoanaerobaculia bacterium]